MEAYGSQLLLNCCLGKLIHTQNDTRFRPS